MCGIFGIISQQPYEVVQKTLQSLQKLLNRGYDSVGIAVVNTVDKQIVKYAGPSALNRLQAMYQGGEFINGNIAIGHTRWATHGGQSDVNAHPHTDCEQLVILVHNGVIDNYDELKKKYKLQCESQTDSEVIAHLIAVYIKLGLTFAEAINKAQSELVGTWALVIINPLEPNKLYVCRRGSPLIVGWGDNEIQVSSEPSVMAQYRDTMMEIKENYLYELLPENRQKYQDEIKCLSCEPIPLNLPPTFNHWMEKEMMEEPQVIETLIDVYKDRDFSNFGKYKICILAGCGTSYFAAQTSRCILLDYGCFEHIYAVDAADDLLPISESINPQEVIFFAFSQSGETRDVLELLKVVKSRGYYSVAVVNVVGSQLARNVDEVVYCCSGFEKGVASTKSFLSQVTVMWMIAQKIAERLIGDVYDLPDIIQKTLEYKDTFRDLAVEFCESEHCFILGKRDTFYIASESSLKMKEIGYLHTEPFTCGSLKHGPLALIERGTPIIIFALDRYYDDCLSAVHEVQARGAKVYLVTDVPKEKIHISGLHVISLQGTNHYHNLISSVIPIQWLCYYIALIKGHNPDCPRSLAKSVTVK